MTNAVTPEEIVKAIWPEADDEGIAEVIEASGGDLSSMIEIALAANRRYKENMQAQEEGSADMLGIARPEGWNARYDGDY